MMVKQGGINCIGRFGYEHEPRKMPTGLKVGIGIIALAVILGIGLSMMIGYNDFGIAVQDDMTRSVTAMPKSHT